MHRTQSQWYARNFSLYYYKEQKEYNSEIGADEVQSYPEEDDVTQRN